MKKLFAIACMFGILACTHVSFAQDESPGRHNATVNQIQTTASADFTFIPAVAEIAFLNTVEPTCTVNACAEVAQYAGFPRACAASEDYGNCRLISHFYNKNTKAIPLLAFTGSPINHSSGGMPFSWRS